jgi:hypothetical protein
MSGGSCAPIENSQPGIHTIPSGGSAGAGVLFSAVGMKVAIGAEAIAGGLGGSICATEVLLKFHIKTTVANRARNPAAIQIQRRDRAVSLGAAFPARRFTPKAPEAALDRTGSPSWALSKPGSGLRAGLKTWRFFSDTPLNRKFDTKGVDSGSRKAGKGTVKSDSRRGVPSELSAAWVTMNTYA